MTDKAPQSINRTQRVLATMVASIVGLALACFAAILIAMAMGVDAKGFDHPIWRFVQAVPFFGLLLAFLLLGAVIVIAAVQRHRQARA
jgi:TRAP-type C4-dicarboxylate transport system permease small subunit